ncbi:MAG TPA: PilZ domain-containing protein [Myxococcota bacterium]
MVPSASGRVVNNRKNPRFRTRFDVLYTNTEAEGAGILVDISYSGARIEDASMRPEVGASVRFYVFVQPVLPFELIGHVVRVTEKGFAIEYDVCDPEVRRLVDDVAAIVTSTEVEKG